MEKNNEDYTCGGSDSDNSVENIYSAVAALSQNDVQYGRMVYENTHIYHEANKTNYNYSNKVCYAKAKGLSFDGLFEKYTIECDGDGNCFIWSALNILRRFQSRANMLSLRKDLQKTYDKLLDDQEYKDKYGLYITEGYKDLKEDCKYVEINPGAVSLAKYTNNKLVVFSKTCGAGLSFVVVNERGELVDNKLDNVKTYIINDRANVIVLKDAHYQALNSDDDSRNNFLKGFFKLFINERYNDAKKSVKECKERALLDIIDVLFSEEDDKKKFHDEIFKIKENIKAPDEKEKKLLEVLESIYKKAKDVNIDQVFPAKEDEKPKTHLHDEIEDEKPKIHLHDEKEDEKPKIHLYDEIDKINKSQSVNSNDDDENKSFIHIDKFIFPAKEDEKPKIHLYDEKEDEKPKIHLHDEIDKINKSQSVNSNDDDDAYISYIINDINIPLDEKTSILNSIFDRKRKPEPKSEKDFLSKKRKGNNFHWL